MERIFAACTACILTGAVLTALPAAHPQSERLGSLGPALQADESSTRVGNLPPAPEGKSTVFGGQIARVDPVRDELTLKVYGQRPMKILFDERTHVYLDGKRIPLHQLHPENHAAVETTLDGTNIFAVSIHLLSQPPQGGYDGRVARYDAGSRELTVISSASREPFKLRVACDAQIQREGQPSFVSAGSGLSDLRPGALVTVDFVPGAEGEGIARKIDVLAIPGAAFAFSGKIASLDLHAGALVLTDTRDQKNYQISFDAARIPSSQDLHLGEHVSIKASYDGAHYVADRITAD